MTLYLFSYICFIYQIDGEPWLQDKPAEIWIEWQERVAMLIVCFAQITKYTSSSTPPNIVPNALQISKRNGIIRYQIRAHSHNLAHSYRYASLLLFFFFLLLLIFFFLSLCQGTRPLVSAQALEQRSHKCGLLQKLSKRGKSRWYKMINIFLIFILYN